MRSRLKMSLAQRGDRIWATSSNQAPEFRPVITAPEGINGFDSGIFVDCCMFLVFLVRHDCQKKSVSIALGLPWIAILVARLVAPDWIVPLQDGFFLFLIVMTMPAIIIAQVGAASSLLVLA